MRGLDRLKRWARRLTGDALVLWLAARDPRTPVLARLIAAGAAAYALSPIDLIPDFIPVLGLLDELLLVPLAVKAAAALIPPPLMDELRAEAARRLDRPDGRGGGWVVAGVWAALILIGATVAWVT